MSGWGRLVWWVGVIGWLAAGAVSEAGAEPEHAVVAGDAFAVSVDAVGGEAVVKFRGKPVMVYAFAERQFKPYVRELRTLRGENVLRDAPADHLHHHGLMFAVQANGVNFWEERTPAGRQVSEAPPRLEVRRKGDERPVVELEHALRWQPAGADGAESALLREKRVLRLTVDPGHEEVGLEWRSEFTAGPGAGKERVRLHGADYNGLGMRLPAELDHVAVFQNSAGLPYSEAQTYDVRPASWSSVTGRVEGREVMVALAAHPSNAGTSTFFSMRNAFAYLAATPSLGKAAVEVPAKGPLVMRYSLVVYPAAQNAEYLTRRFAPFLSSR